MHDFAACAPLIQAGNTAGAGDGAGMGNGAGTGNEAGAGNTTGTETTPVRDDPARGHALDQTWDQACRQKNFSKKFFSMHQRLFLRFLLNRTSSKQEEHSTF